MPKKRVMEIKSNKKPTVASNHFRMINAVNVLLILIRALNANV